MTNKELLDKIRNEILHLKMKELQRTNGINTGADVYLSSYAVLSILSNALTEESEDERIRAVILKLVLGMRDEVFTTADKSVTKPKVLDWLEKQKEQKPAWSEEDEDMLNCCISSIEEAKENRYAYKETDGDTSYDREIAFLKSLRPSWKPSDEQMNCLCAAVDAAIRKHNESVSGYKPARVLKSLYEDLQRL